MAAGATIKTSTTYDSSFWVSWAVEGQSVAENRTTIRWACGFTPGHQFYSNAVKMSAVAINGSTVYAGGTYSDITDYKDRTFASGTLDIAHNADGTKTFAVGAFSGQVWKNSGYLSAPAAEQSFELTTIPRATVPSIGSVTIGSKVTIDLPRASSTFTHTVSYTFGGASGVIATGAGTEAEWTVPEELAAQLPNAGSGTGTLVCQTYNGTSLIGSKEIPFTAAVPGSMKPTLSAGWAAVAYDNSGTKASGIAAWVQGYSKAKAIFDGSKVACRHGASVKGYSITYLGKTVTVSPYRTDTISATSAVVRCTVTDSRGLSAWEDIPVTLNEYAPPVLVGADLFRSDGDCAAADSGTHIAGIATVKFSALNGLNSVRLTGCWKGVGGSYGSGVTMQSGAAGLVTGSVEIAADRSYVARLTATDGLGNTAVYEENIPTEKIAFHLREGGLGAAFGKAAEADHVLELAEDWTLKVHGKACVAAEHQEAAAEKVAVLDGSGAVGYRTAAELAGDMSADCIVEQGTSGMWTYRKWAGGLAECWLTEPVTDTYTYVFAQLGGRTYRKSYSLPSGLFSKQVTGTANARVGSDIGWTFLGIEGTSTIYVFVTAEQDNSQCTLLGCEIKGRWK